jgi:hypothetical protein
MESMTWFTGFKGKLGLPWYTRINQLYNYKNYIIIYDGMSKSLKKWKAISIRYKHNKAIKELVILYNIIT